MAGILHKYTIDLQRLLAITISLDFSLLTLPGTGSVLTLEEEVEMDALVMSGTELLAGAVAAIKNVKNPVKVARLVMEKTPHVMLAGKERERLMI